MDAQITASGRIPPAAYILDMRIDLSAALFALAFAGLAAAIAGPGARAEGAAIEAAQGGGEIELAQLLRERGASNRYKEQIRSNLFKGQRGDAYALRQIGFHYAKGWGVIRDLTKAYMWFSLAIREGNEEARANRDAIAAALSAEQIARAEAMAEHWLETHEWEIEAGSFGG